MCVVVVVEIIKLYLVPTGRFLATTGYVAPSPNHVHLMFKDHSVSQYSISPMSPSTPKTTHQKPAPWLSTPEPPEQTWAIQGHSKNE